ARAHPPGQSRLALARDDGSGGAEAPGERIAALLERAHALRSVADRHFLRTEVIGIEHALQRLGLLERPPIRARARPGAVRAPEGIEAVLRRVATQSLVGHVLAAARASPYPRPAHDARQSD